MSQPLNNIYLAFWNLGNADPVSVVTVRERLVQNNLNAERAADVPASTAFRRAADSVRSKEVEAKSWTCKETGLVRVQIDSIGEEDGRLRRSFVGQYELSEDDVPVHVTGKELPEFVPAFDAAITHYTRADISKVIQAILEKDGLGAFTPRKGGGVYFIPVAPTATDLLTRIEQFAASVDVRFLTYTVPDTAAQKAEIADAIAVTFEDQIKAHADAIGAYELDTKPGILDNRAESIAATLAHLDRLSHLLNGRYQTLSSRIYSLNEQLASLKVKVDAHAAAQVQQRRQAGGRRIVPVAAVAAAG